LRDAQEGIRRNLRASVAAILLIFISLSITGTLFLLKTGVDNLTGFLESQVKIKVFVDLNVNTQQVADLLRSQAYVQSVSIETRGEALDSMRSFFTGNEDVLTALSESPIPDAISIELKDKNHLGFVAEQLKSMNGITDVVYGQEFAKKVLSWSDTLNHYGLMVLAVLLVSSFLTIHITVNLAMVQRRKEIRIKLLLGARETHVRNQFLFEGFILGLVSSILASFVIYFIYRNGLFPLQLNYGTIFHFTPLYMNLTMFIVMIAGAFIGLSGSYFSSRKLIDHG
jgi:cell division transport system permease protein